MKNGRFPKTSDEVPDRVRPGFAPGLAPKEHQVEVIEDRSSWRYVNATIGQGFMIRMLGEFHSRGGRTDPTPEFRDSNNDWVAERYDRESVEEVD